MQGTSVKSNSGVLFKAGEQHVVHGVSREATIINGVTCQTKYAVVVVEGEPRHLVYEVVCT